MGADVHVMDKRSTYLAGCKQGNYRRSRSLGFSQEMTEAGQWSMWLKVGPLICTNAHTKSNWLDQDIATKLKWPL